MSAPTTLTPAAVSERLAGIIPSFLDHLWVLEQTGARAGVVLGLKRLAEELDLLHDETRGEDAGRGTIGLFGLR